MIKVASRFLFFLLLAGSCLPARAQLEKPLTQMPASARQLIEIKATGSKRFPEAAIIAATGLQPGPNVTEDDFKRAARRLGDTGAFTDVAYSFSYTIAGTKVEFHVTDSTKFVPARFEDFVWFSDAALLGRIKQSVPLFDGELPLNGGLPDQVSDVLQAMLVEKAIPGHVNYVRSGKTDGPVTSIDYSVSDVLIRVRKIDFTGVGDAERGPLQNVAQGFSDREYSRSRLDAFVQHQLLPVFHARGFLKAAFGEPQPKVVEMPSADAREIATGPAHQTVVDVIYAVTPGEAYKLKSLNWSGNHEVPTSTLAGMVRAELGQPANTVRLLDQLKSIEKLYGSRGFMTANIKVNAQYDDPAATVAMVVDIREGPVFHMGDLEFRGLDNSLTAKLRNLWKIRQGDVYDATYLDDYLPEAHKLLPTRLDWSVDSHVTANLADKTVDVDLIYTVKAPAPE
jgi:outer membrane protein assembly factor BamA